LDLKLSLLKLLALVCELLLLFLEFALLALCRVLKSLVFFAERGELLFLNVGRGVSEVLDEVRDEIVGADVGRAG
jgi:hypothetical protein